MPWRQRSRKIKNETVMQFQLLLKNGTLEFVYKSNDTSSTFNSFLYSFLNTSQKKIIRIMANVKPRNSYRSLFKRLEILTPTTEYIFSLMNFIANYQEHFQANSASHSVNTSDKHDLHGPGTNMSCFQKNACHQNFQESTM
jgi:hypothetical protein